MNERRVNAFNEWWLLKAEPEGRMTPSAIWDAACDWMLEEVRWRVEKTFDREANESEHGQS